MLDETIAWYQIIAAVVTGVVVWLAARQANWPLRATVTSALGTALLVAAWRELANVWGLNEDFMPLVSIGDAACLIAGAVAPAVLAFTVRGARVNRSLPIVAGGIAAFVVNVLIL